MKPHLIIAYSPNRFGEGPTDGLQRKEGDLNLDR